MQIKNVKISSASLGFEGHGILTSTIIVDYGDSSGQGFGGFCLKGEAMYDWVSMVLKVLEISDWKDVNGCYCRVKLNEQDMIEEIGNITKEIWFNPKKFFNSKRMNNIMNCLKDRI